MINFKGKHYPKDVILFAVYFMSVTPFPITISRRSLRNEASMWITPP